MSVSPYTLQNLYAKGILDYAPMELANSINVSSLNGMQNPYLNMATQGNLYQNHGMQQDSFSYNGFNSAYNNSIDSQAGLNSFGSINGNILTNNSDAGLNGFGNVNGNIITNNSQAGINGFGGAFGKLGDDLSNTASKTPNVVKGLIAGGIMIASTILLFKKCKKAPPKQQTNTNFFDKLKFWKK